MKKFLAMLLVLAMALTMVPMTAMAATFSAIEVTYTGSSAGRVQFYDKSISVAAGQLLELVIEVPDNVKTISIRDGKNAWDDSTNILKVSPAEGVEAGTMVSCGGNWYKILATPAYDWEGFCVTVYVSGEATPVKVYSATVINGDDRTTYDAVALATHTFNDASVELLNNLSGDYDFSVEFPEPEPDPVLGEGEVYVYDLSVRADGDRAIGNINAPVVTGDIITFWVKIEGPHNDDVYDMYARAGGVAAGYLGIDGEETGVNVYSGQHIPDNALCVSEDGWYYIACVAKSDAPSGYELAVDTSSKAPSDVLNGAKIAGLKVNGETVKLVGTPEVMDEPEVGEINATVSVSLGDDLKLNVYVENYFEDINNVSVSFTMNDDTVVVTGKDAKKTSCGTYRFTYKGISPEKMGDNVDMVITIDGDVFRQATTSLETYLKGLVIGDNEELATLVNDVLVYGGAAQEYRKYNTENLVSDGVTGTVFDITGVESVKGTTSNANGYNFISANLWFDYSNAIIFKFAAADVDSVSLTVNDVAVEFEEVEPGVYKAITNHIAPTDFDETYTAVLTDADGNELATATYSVNSYVVNKCNSNNVALANLVKALYNYGVSAEAYKAAN